MNNKPLPSTFWKLLQFLGCITVLSLGVAFIWQAVYVVNHPRPHPNELAGLGAIVLAAVLGWPLVCIGFCMFMGMLRGQLLRGLGWGVCISMATFIVGMVGIGVVKGIIVWFRK